ncbi:acyl-CoA thioesterase [Alphaproteobacteria bacterium]|nr:acyl-CoA thioesterase [Alphaproteobacteria bacterium]
MNSNKVKNIPNNEPSIRTIAMPADANANGDIFGGWVLSQMDIAGGVIASKQCSGRSATVAIDSMVFYKPVFIGDLVSIFAEIIKIGNTSMTVQINAIATRKITGEEVRVTEGKFVYVAIDEDGKPVSVKP